MCNELLFMTLSLKFLFEYHEFSELYHLNVISVGVCFFVIVISSLVSSHPHHFLIILKQLILTGLNLIGMVLWSLNVLYYQILLS